MSENPLKQYFRRPAIYIKLPSNYMGYDSNVIDVPENGELPVYPMTAIDEITSRTPDAVFNGNAVADIVKSCVPAIKDPWSITSIDLDTVLVAIRVASNGENMDIMSTCPACNNEAKFGINLGTVLGHTHSFSYDKVLKVRDLEIKFKPMTYRQSNKNNMDQYEIQKNYLAIQEMQDEEIKAKESKRLLETLSKTMNDAFSETIEYIKTPETTVTNQDFIKEFLLNCDKRTNSAIMDFSVELKNSNQMQPLKMQCQSCQHIYDQQLILNITDFFA